MANCTTEMCPGLLGRRRRRRTVWSGAGTASGDLGHRRLMPGRAGRARKQEPRSRVAAATLAGLEVVKSRPHGEPRSRAESALEVANRRGEAGSRLVASWAHGLGQVGPRSVESRSRG